nr:hypothetical protein [uncultured Rhodopila sp.]
MDFIENDEFIGVRSEVEFGLAQPGPVGVRFQIEVERWPGCANLKRERRFADLIRTEQGNGGQSVGQMDEARRQRRPIILAILEIDSRIAIYMLTGLAPSSLAPKQGVQAPLRAATTASLRLAPGDRE